MTSTIPSLSAHQISVSARYLSPGFCSVAPVRFGNHPSVPCLTLRLLSRASSCPELLFHGCYEEKEKKKTAVLTTQVQGHLGLYELLYCQSLCPCVLADTQQDFKILRRRWLCLLPHQDQRCQCLTQVYSVASHVSSKLPTVTRFITRFCFCPGGFLICHLSLRGKGWR